MKPNEKSPSSDASDDAGETTSSADEEREGRAEGEDALEQAAGNGEPGDDEDEDEDEALDGDAWPPKPAAWWHVGDAIVWALASLGVSRDFLRSIVRPEEDEATFWELIRDTYLSFDRRTLGFTRIFLGFLLITDLLRRTWDWEAMFSTEGVLPNHVNLWRPQGSNFSLVNAFSTPAELWALWFVMLATFTCVLIGYKTRVAQVLSLVFVASMNGRILLIENGGYVVYNLLLLWTCFLPLGDRFSVDALLESMRRKREATAADLNDRSDLIPEEKLRPYVSFVGLVILIQISAIYYFNVIHKTGPAWRNGTAVHYVLYVDRMVNPIVGLVREHLPLWSIIILTKFVIAAEAAIPVCLLSPLGKVWARRLAVVLMCALHIGFGTVFVLGPFAWALCVFSTLLFTTDDWAIAIQTMRRTHRARVVLYDPRSGAATLAVRLLARMDRFELLTFREEEGLATGIAAEAPGGGSRLARSLAWADIIAALPLGPVVAWVLRLPVIRHVIDAIHGALEGGRLSRFFGIRAPSLTYLAPPPPPYRAAIRKGTRVVRELLVAAMFAGAVNQALTELWVVNRRIKVPQPEPLRSFAHKLRFLQGWFMFSPNPVMDDGTIVVDAITVDGRHVDPFTGKEPNWDLPGAKSLGYNQIWSDYYNRMHLSQNTGFRDAMKEYIYRLPERTGRKEDAIMSGDVYWVQDMNPKWREKSSFKYEKVKLFSFENPRAKAQASTN